MSQKRRLALARDCGLCRACCTTQEVEALPGGAGDEFLRKPKDTACPHLASDPNDKGCTIYADRPQACRDWMCVWRSGSPVLEGSERPDRIGVVLDTVVRKDLPFSFLVAVAADPSAADACLTMAEKTIERLVSRGHLVVVEKPDGFQVVRGPQAKVDLYVERSRVK